MTLDQTKLRQVIESLKDLKSLSRRPLKEQSSDGRLGS